MAECEGMALVMSGGGARCAYQAGFLSGLVQRRPDFCPRILTGVSAGAINAAFLANAEGPFHQRVAALRELWSGIEVEDVFATRFSSLIPSAMKWALRLATGRAGGAIELRGMVDTSPLEGFLQRALGTSDGRLPGIERNLAAGELDAVALTASSYSTGRSLTWVQGREIENWTRAHRTSESRPIEVGHILASAALPLLFPAVRIANEWFGDGGIRLTAPLSPAVHLGAKRILALSIRRERGAEPPVEPDPGYPPPAQVAGALLSAIFLDQFDADALRLQRINRLITSLDEEARGGLRPLDLVVHRPSADLGRLANEFEAKLPTTLRFLTRGLGTKQARSNDLLSLIMFQHDYMQSLIELGEKDAAAQAASLDAFLDGRA